MKGRAAAFVELGCQQRGQGRFAAARYAGYGDKESLGAIELGVEGYSAC